MIVQYIVYLISFVFFFAGVTKLFGLKKHREHFKEWKLGLTGMYTVGLVELVGAVLLMSPTFISIGIIIAVFTMSGAMVTLIKAKAFKQLLIPTSFYALSIFCLWQLVENEYLAYTVIIFTAVLIFAGSLILLNINQAKA